MKDHVGDLELLANQNEYRSFLRNALAWKGTITPKILPRVFWTGAYSALIWLMMKSFPHAAVAITPFEYTGAVLGVLLVARVNAGMGRWWEARRVWGNIVNQSRNLATVVSQYSPGSQKTTVEILNWISVWPHIMRHHLRNEHEPSLYRKFINESDLNTLISSHHKPVHVSLKIAENLAKLRQQGMDDFSFHRAERERSLLIDAIGSCERIQSTPIPFVLATKTRRFIFLFLLLLPLPLVDEVGYLTPLIMMLASYPLFCLDEIGIELQNPFSKSNLSHLPLVKICENISNNIEQIKSSIHTRSTDGSTKDSKDTINSQRREAKNTTAPSLQ